MNLPEPCAVVWFRRALRLDDNASLAGAIATGLPVLCLFVLDPAHLNAPDVAPGRVRFLLQGLAELDAALRVRGSRLVVRHGNPEDVLDDLVVQHGVRAVFHHCETEPMGRERDKRVASRLGARGVSCVAVEDHLAVPPGMVLTGKGTPYTVFTPFRRNWEGHPVPAPSDAPQGWRVAVGPASDPIPPLPAGPDSLVAAGEDAALRHWDLFCLRGLRNYATDRDLPGVSGTSGLSAHLKFGMISVRRMLADLGALLRSASSEEARESLRVYRSELAWRDFYHHILHHFPRVESESFQRRFDALAWENEPSLIEAWETGRTGYPFVDAAMRQLSATGWMHNRARMVVASFLTKDLLVDWRIGERHFRRHLIDWDLAANNGGWQWAASTGTDAQPWFRIFNPITQGQRFDPDGNYVRKWVPELADIPARWIHEPGAAPEIEQSRWATRMGIHYPRPVVDHGRQRERALAMFRKCSEEAVEP